MGLFAAVSNGNALPVLEGLAPRFEHFFSRRSCPGRIAFHAGENEAVVRAALSAAAGHQFRSARHPWYMTAYSFHFAVAEAARFLGLAKHSGH